MNPERAFHFVTAQASPVEQARLENLRFGRRLSPEVTTAMLAGQRADGGWEPFWARDYSSLDATCYRLAQVEQLGLDAAHPAMAAAAHFLAGRQQPDGSWEEDAVLAEQAPPWVQPGELASLLYLTANCGFWLAVLATDSPAASRAADFLQAQVSADGRLPSFLHAHWLGGALLQRLGRPAEPIFAFLLQRVEGLEASNLAWLLLALHLGGVPAGHDLVQASASRLESMQAEDGGWHNPEEPNFDVHVTLEALRALRLAGKWEPG